MKQIITLCFLLITCIASSQKITKLVWLDNEEVKNLTERKLVICSNSTSDAQIARLEAALGKAKDDKKKAIQDAIENQKVLANLFKDQVKELIQANWTAHNTEGIEVKLLRN